MAWNGDPKGSDPRDAWIIVQLLFVVFVQRFTQIASVRAVEDALGWIFG